MVSCLADRHEPIGCYAASSHRCYILEYYRELIGGNSASDSRTTHIDEAPGWQRSVEQASNGFPEQHVWTGFPNGRKIVLLNADVAIVRDLNPSNMDGNGRVSCNFRRTGRCPENTNAIQFAIDCK